MSIAKEFYLDLSEYKWKKIKICGSYWRWKFKNPIT